MTQRIKAVIEYDGTDFFGWQIQKEGRTVQGVVEEILSRRFDRPVSVVGAGRTDSGVHARGQVFHFDCQCTDEIGKLKHSLESMLPPDISLCDLRPVEHGFHARFSAVSRTYRYVISLNRSALEYRYAWDVPPPLDIPLMRKELAALEGTHDFKPFAKLNPGEKHYRCTLKKTSVRKEKNRIILLLTAGRFLHGMVRAITGTLVDIGKGAREPGLSRKILDSHDRSLVSTLAPARGLFLERVDYQ